MLVFVKVVENGSISAASRAAGRPRRPLASRSGFWRTGSATDCCIAPEAASPDGGGAGLLRKCRDVATRVEEAVHAHAEPGRPAARRAQGHVQRRVREIAAHSGAAGVLSAAHPDLTLSLELSDRRLDLEEEDIDAGIRFAEQLDNPQVIVRKIMENERILCAAPAYLERCGTPERFADLARFNCLRTSSIGGLNAWVASVDGVEEAIDATGNFEGNSADVVFNAALAGLGIARLSGYLVADRIRSGDLVRVLPGYTQKNADIAVIFAQKRLLAPRTRAFVDFVTERFRGRRPVA